MSSYDFNKREDYDYSFSYAYLGGVGLGKSEVEVERIRKSKLGTYEMTPVDPPPGQGDEVVRIANMINSSKQREELVKKIFETKDARLEFVWNKKHQLNPYFEWALHCIDRQVVGWENIGQRSVTFNEPVRSEAKPSPQLKIGDTVEISNIKARPELNGKIGQVVNVTNDRVMVEFSDINQTVSIAKSNCLLVHQDSTDTLWKANLPRGLKVEIRGLASDQGKLLNGLNGTIVDYKSERFLIRLDDPVGGDLKSVKECNLYVLLPDGWSEKMDESSGKPYYVRHEDQSVSWDHPILSRSKQKRKPKEKSEEFVKLDTHEEVSDSEAREETESGFKRDEFLCEEAKRLKLDRRGKKTAAKAIDMAETVAGKLDDLRNALGFAREEALFSGNPRDLLEIIRECKDDAKLKFLFAGLCMILEDYKKLKFNKNQLTVLGDKIDDVIENEGHFPDSVIGWIESGLQIAIPTRYSI
jgi:hypothetical protein